MKTSPETRLLNKLKGETMLVAKIILTSESPVEVIEGKRQQQPFPNSCYNQNHQRVTSKGSQSKLQPGNSFLNNTSDSDD